jgi:hypothetical protein
MTQEPIPAYTPMSWWQRKVSKEADRDILKMGERIGNVIAIVLIVVFALILIDFQLSDNGFFTSAFGPVEQVLFYGSLLYGIVPSLMRAAVGKRNQGRFADLFGSLFSIIVLSYFLVTFPFDFTVLLGYLPASIQPAFSWFTNDLVRVLFMVGIVVTAITLVYNTVLYVFVRRELNIRKSGTSQI